MSHLSFTCLSGQKHEALHFPEHRIHLPWVNIKALKASHFKIKENQCRNGAFNIGLHLLQPNSGNLPFLKLARYAKYFLIMLLEDGI